MKIRRDRGAVDDPLVRAVKMATLGAVAYVAIGWLLALGLLGGAAYVLLHFVAKYW